MVPPIPPNVASHLCYPCQTSFSLVNKTGGAEVSIPLPVWTSTESWISVLSVYFHFKSIMQMNVTYLSAYSWSVVGYAQAVCCLTVAEGVRESEFSIGISLIQWTFNSPALAHNWKWSPSNSLPDSNWRCQESKLPILGSFMQIHGICLLLLTVSNAMLPISMSLQHFLMCIIAAFLIPTNKNHIQ